MKLATRKRSQDRAAAKLKLRQPAKRQPVNLTHHEIGLLLQLRDEGYSYAWLAVKFEISKSYAFDLCNFRRSGVRWRPAVRKPR